MLRNRDLTGRRFLDIGCGSGLHALAAIRLGASEVIGIDIDPQSVETARKVVARHAPPNSSWRFETRSVFELCASDYGLFDVVYSWGVLHHTGDMLGAIGRAAEMVNSKGEFLVALYRESKLCQAWKIEKRIYSSGPRWLQRIIRSAYLFSYAIALRLRGSSLSARRKEYVKHRGMSFDHDVHDWLGGFPYESIMPGRLIGVMNDLGFSLDTDWELTSGKRKSLGLLGSGCFEQAYTKR
jgi:2-polyprenyl-6-hydroxyphenyl methylase/3-demethylubiquinone-9 3-methyltransferase